MNYEYHQSAFSRAMLTGVFVGIISTILCMVYNIIYRDKTGFSMQDLINVSSLIFFVNLLFLIIGIIYFIFLKSFKKGEIIFSVLFVLFTLFLIWRASGAHRTDDHMLNVQFRGLLLGIIIILGLDASFLVPYLFHNKTFQRDVI